MVVGYAPGAAAFQASTPRVWAQARLADLSRTRSFDVHPDGKRILIVEAPEGQAGLAENQAIIRFNLFEELRRTVRPSHERR
jgi:hypothetical protein